MVGAFLARIKGQPFLERTCPSAARVWRPPDITAYLSPYQHPARNVNAVLRALLSELGKPIDSGRRSGGGKACPYTANRNGCTGHSHALETPLRQSRSSSMIESYTGTSWTEFRLPIRANQHR